MSEQIYLKSTPETVEIMRQVVSRAKQARTWLEMAQQYSTPEGLNLAVRQAYSQIQTARGLLQGLVLRANAEGCQSSAARSRVSSSD